MAEEAAPMEAAEAAPAPEPATPRDSVIAALMWLKKTVDVAAQDGPPQSTAATSTAELLGLPILQQQPLDADAVAAELLHAGSHIRLLQAEGKKSRKRIQELQAEVVQLRKAARGGAPAADEAAAPAVG